MVVLSCAFLFATPWTVARQASLSTEFSRQEYWSGLPFPSLGDLPDPGIKPMSPALAGRFFTIEPQEKPWYTLNIHTFIAKKFGGLKKKKWEVMALVEIQ